MKPRLGILMAFLFSFFYWAYLTTHTRMEIQFDSLDYERLGKMLSEGKFEEFFTTGPQREPIYPLLIALAIKIGGFFQVSYYTALCVLQMGILFLTQGLTSLLLRRLNIHPTISALTILYLGLSPGIVNSALSMYSEIAVYPFVLGIILILATAWQSWEKIIPMNRNFIYALGFSLCFICATFVKAVFELIFPLFLIPFIIIGARSFFNKNSNLFKNSLVFLLTAFVIFYSAITTYKWINKAYNGQFVVTNRGAWALYGNTDRRMQPITFRRFLVALSYVPGEGVCRKIYGPEECSFWSFRESDGRGFNKIHELTARGMNEAQMNQQMLRLSIQKAFGNPPQYFLLWVLEGFKMLFWESTQIGWVDYPMGLQKLYDWVYFKNGLRLGVFLLTFWAINVAVFSFFKRRSSSAISLILLLILIYIGLHAFFFTLTRYALPIAPLYLVLIAFAANSIRHETSINS